MTKLHNFSRLFSKIAQFLAVSTTLTLAPLLLLETYFGVSGLFDRLTWDAALMCFIGVGGIIGVVGLWLRAFVNPDVLRTNSLSVKVSWMLLSGSLSALAFSATIIYAIVTDIDASNVGGGVFGMMVFFFTLGLVGLAMATQNYLAIKMRLVRVKGD